MNQDGSFMISKKGTKADHFRNAAESLFFGNSGMRSYQKKWKENSFFLRFLSIGHEN
jgi:hypothetical protein